MFELQSSCQDCLHCSTRIHSLFSVLNSEEIAILQKQKTHVTLDCGETLFKEGQYPPGFYIITKGKLKYSKFGFEKREQIIRFAKEGDVVGYRSFIGEESYNCTAIAISEVCLCFLKHDLIQQLFKSNSDLPFQFMKVLANDLKTSETKILHLTQNTVRERIAESILLLAEFYGTEDDGITINVSLKRDELAGIAGTIRESAIRTLYEFNESNIIELTGKKIIILDAQKLQRIANASL